MYFSEPTLGTFRGKLEIKEKEKNFYANNICEKLIQILYLARRKRWNWIS